MVNDIISDILTRIRNAIMAKHKIVQLPATKMTVNLVTVLQREGFIEDFDELKANTGNFLLVTLKYKGKKKTSIIRQLKRISRPGLRIYARSKDLPKVLGGIGTAIISTSRGVMTSKEAKYHGLGGEILCYIW